MKKNSAPMDLILPSSLHSGVENLNSVSKAHFKSDFKTRKVSWYIGHICIIMTLGRLLYT
jgi:hypothetical protein